MPRDAVTGRMLSFTAEQAVEAFLTNVDKTEGCWLWRPGPASTTCPYGTLKRGGRMVLAHRYAYTVFIGEIPEGLQVLHSCDTPLCVNPAHLSVGTAQDNSSDMVAKGRSAKGELSNINKLVTAQVLQVRDMYATGRYTQREVAGCFGISQLHVSRIVRRKSWSHV